MPVALQMPPSKCGVGGTSGLENRVDKSALGAGGGWMQPWDWVTSPGECGSEEGVQGGGIFRHQQI